MRVIYCKPGGPGLGPFLPSGMTYKTFVHVHLAMLHAIIVALDIKVSEKEINFK
jgi:hypothetical protein